MSNKPDLIQTKPRRPDSLRQKNLEKEAEEYQKALEREEEIREERKRKRYQQVEERRNSNKNDEEEESPEEELQNQRILDVFYRSEPPPGNYTQFEITRDLSGTEDQSEEENTETHAGIKEE